MVFQTSGTSLDYAYFQIGKFTLDKHKIFLKEYLCVLVISFHIYQVSTSFIKVQLRLHFNMSKTQ